MEKALAGKVAIVTGSSRGIGKGIALAYADAGAKVVLASRTVKDMEAVAADIGKRGGTAAVMQMDAYNYDQTESVIDATVEQFGKLDILVNNAGGSRNVDGGSTGFMLTTRTALEDVFRLNLFSPFIMAQKAARVMIKQRSGSIINITSPLAFYQSPSLQAYGAAKAALQELTQLWAVELGVHGVRVNGIAPGPIWSAQLEKIYTTEESRREVDKRIPLGRVGQPRDVGATAVFLASDAAEWVSGAIVLVSGGYRHDEPLDKFMGRNL